MNIDSIQVTLGLQQSLGHIITARQSRPVKADVLLLLRVESGGQHSQEIQLQGYNLRGMYIFKTWYILNLRFCNVKSEL